MDAFERFLTTVQLRSGLDRRAAERASQAVLTTLFERISGGQTDDVLPFLHAPDGFVPATTTLPERRASTFSVEEFLSRAAQRENADKEAVRGHAVVVLRALRTVVPAEEFQDTVDQLPADFAELTSTVSTAGASGSSAPDVVRAVADRSGTAAEEAGQVTDAVLQVLAERLPDEHVDALAQQLPELRAALARGRRERSAPRQLTAESFLELLGQRLGTKPAKTREHAEDVLLAVTEAVDDPLLADLLTQLPDDYADLLVSGRVRTAPS